MERRLELQKILEEILGSKNVYFQPPASIRLKYPCIIYNRSSSYNEFADDVLYRYLKRYSVTVIDRNPDSKIPDKVENLRYCSFERFFTSDDLNHYVFNLYF